MSQRKKDHMIRVFCIILLSTIVMISGCRTSTPSVAPGEWSFLAEEVEQLKNKISHLENRQDFLIQHIEFLSRKDEDVQKLHAFNQNVIKELVKETCSENSYRKQASVEMKKIEKEQLTLIYPEVQGLACSFTQNMINKLIEYKIYEVLTHSFSVDDLAAYTYEAKANVTYNDHGLLSILFQYELGSGNWAHPGKELSALTLDLSNGLMYQLPDFFIQPLDTIAFVNDQIYEKFNRLSDDSVKEGFQGISENQEFYLTEEHLVILYKLGGNALPYLEIKLDLVEIGEFLIIDDLTIN